MRVCIGVEDIDDGVFADREHQAIGGLRAAELIEVGFELLRLTAQIYGLAQKSALDQHIRLRPADLVGFAAGVSRHPKGVAEPEALVDLRIDPDFGAPPRPDTGIECGIDRFSAIGGRAEALGSLIRGPECRLQQPDICCLAVNGPALRFDLLGLFRGDRHTLRLRRRTNHLGATDHWPAQNADRGSAKRDRSDEDDIARQRLAKCH